MGIFMRTSGIALLFVLLAAVSAFGERTVRVDSREALVHASRDARAGDTIVIAAGVYEGGVYFGGLRGEPGKPITITGGDVDDPPIFRGSQQGLYLSNPRHVVLEHVIIEQSESNGLNIDDGGTGEASASDIVIRHVVVRDVQSSGNHDGIKLSGVSDFRIEHVTVERWGENGQGIDMVGCHRGVVAEATLRHDESAGYGSTGITTKGGSSEITITHCRFEHVGDRGVNIGGSTGLAYFRPQPPPPYEAKDITVTRSEFIGGEAAVAFVGVDGAVVSYNTMYRPGRWVLRILQETVGEDFVPSRNGRFEHNIVVFRRDELAMVVNVGPDTAPQTFRFAGNWWYGADSPERSRPELPVAERDGVYGRDPRLRDTANGDLRPERPVPAGAHMER